MFAAGNKWASCLTVCHGKQLQTRKQLLNKWWASDPRSKMLVWHCGSLCLHCGGCGLSENWPAIAPLPSGGKLPVDVESLLPPWGHGRLEFKISRCCTNAREKESAPSSCCPSPPRSQPCKARPGPVLIGTAEEADMPCDLVSEGEAGHCPWGLSWRLLPTAVVFLGGSGRVEPQDCPLFQR